MKRKRKINKYDAFIFVLIASLLFGCLGGALMLVRVLTILFIPVLIFKYRFCRDYVQKYSLVFILFYIFCLISLLWTADIKEAWKELVYYPVHLLLFLEILVFSRFAKNPLKSISTGWLIGVGLTLVVAVWEIVTSNHLPTSMFEAEDEVVRVGGISIERPFAAATFGNFNSYVVYICFAMPFLYYYILNNYRQVLKTILSTIILVSSIIVILVNASRGGLLTSAVMGAIFLLMTKKSKYKTLFVIALAVFAVIFIVPRMETLFLAMSLKSEGGGAFTDEGRIEIWMVSLEVLANYGFIGTGIGGMAAAIKAYNPSVINITHNMFLELLVQYGVLFFIFFMVYLFKLFLQARKQKNSSIKILLYMALLAMPIYSIIDSGYLLNPIIYTALASLTVFAYINKINPIAIKEN